MQFKKHVEDEKMFL